ncbi:MAG: Uma2 family endonuclease [Acidobacteria bacterium]|nr:Uma2 family endonuclease [Acidobacteriota bacterium]
MATQVWEARRAGPVPGTAVEPLWPVTVDTYHHMIAAGVLTSDHQVELLEGAIVAKMPKNVPRSFFTPELADALATTIPRGWHVRTQEPVTLSASEPEPDIAVVRGSRRDYLGASRHPGSADIALIVEVTDTTGHRDRVTKKRIYAAAGIPAYWILDVAARTLEVYSDCDPENENYRTAQIFSANGEAPVEIPGETPRLLPLGPILK